MKKIIAMFLIICVTFSFIGCVEQPVEQAEYRQSLETRKLLNQINNEIGMPNIKEFYEKKMAKEIIEIRDNSKLITYVYTQNLNGKFIYIGKAMGFGLPYSTQYTNPQQYVGVSAPSIGIDRVQAYQYSYETMPQAEPNGLYMPDSASATWIMLINEETGKREVMYMEPNAVVTQSKIPKRLVESWSLPDNY